MEPDDEFKADVVFMILDGKTERALEMLSAKYRVRQPKLRVGAVKKHSKDVEAVHVAERGEIVVATREGLYDPFVIIHEFYHHIRSHGDWKRQNERKADEMAFDYIRGAREREVRRASGIPQHAMKSSSSKKVTSAQGQSPTPD